MMAKQLIVDKTSLDFGLILVRRLCAAHEWRSNQGQRKTIKQL